jgi:hypothetical protein
MNTQPLLSTYWRPAKDAGGISAGMALVDDCCAGAFSPKPRTATAAIATTFKTLMTHPGTDGQSLPDLFRLVNNE